MDGANHRADGDVSLHALFKWFVVYFKTLIVVYGLLGGGYHTLAWILYQH